MEAWLKPLRDKQSREALKLLAQIIFSFLTFFLGVGLLVYGIHKNNNLAMTWGTGFIGTGIGTWVSP